jgi:hypothetical protein
MNSDANTQLSNAIEDAERLLRYASAKGNTVPSELVSDIIDAKKLLAVNDTDESTFADQKKFWEALSKLTALTLPATIDSVRFAAATQTCWLARLWAWMTRSTARPTSMGERAVTWAGLIAATALIILGVLQLYADVGSSTVQEYSANKLKYEINHRLLPATPPQPESDADATLRAQTAQLLERSTRQLAEMDIWLRKVPLLPPFKNEPGTPEHSEEVLAQTDLILIVLRGFLLPIGWGFIGAALYVCRTLADDISKMSYSAEHRMLHFSRYSLGAVAGFVVAKFSVALSGKSIDDVVQPYVLALLVGYSVDVLFTMFDRIISAFSSR